MSILFTAQVHRDIVKGLCTSKRMRHKLQLPGYLRSIVALIRLFVPGIVFGGFERTNVERMYRLTASVSGELFSTDFRRCFLMLSTSSDQRNKLLMKKPKGFHNSKAVVGSRICVDSTHTIYFQECVGLGKEIIRKITPSTTSKETLCKRFANAKPRRVFMFNNVISQRTFCCTSKGDLFFTDGREVLRWDRDHPVVIGHLPAHVDGAFDMCMDEKNWFLFFLTTSSNMGDLQESKSSIDVTEKNELWATRVLVEGLRHRLLYSIDFGEKCSLYYIPGTNRTVFSAHGSVFLIYSNNRVGCYLLELGYSIPELSKKDLSPRKSLLRKSASGHNLTYYPPRQVNEKTRKWTSFVWLSKARRYAGVCGTDGLFFFDPL